MEFYRLRSTETPEQMELRLAARRDVNLRPQVRRYTFIALNVVSITIQASLEFLTLILQNTHSGSPHDAVASV